MKKRHPYFKGRIVLTENHCTYKDGQTDLAWELSIDNNLVGAIWKLYDEDFYKLVLTSFGNAKIPKYQCIFGTITDAKNEFKTIKLIIDELIKEIKSSNLKSVEIVDSFKITNRGIALMTKLDFDSEHQKFNKGDKVSYQDRIYEVLSIEAALKTKPKTGRMCEEVAFISKKLK